MTGRDRSFLALFLPPALLAGLFCVAALQQSGKPDRAGATGREAPVEERSGQEESTKSAPFDGGLADRSPCALSERRLDLERPGLTGRTGVVLAPPFFVADADRGNSGHAVAAADPDGPTRRSFLAGPSLGPRAPPA